MYFISIVAIRINPENEDGLPKRGDHAAEKGGTAAETDNRAAK